MLRNELKLLENMLFKQQSSNLFYISFNTLRLWRLRALSELGHGSSQDVSQFLEDAPTERSAAIMQDWLNEIAEEIIFLVQRKEEVEKEHAELKRRLESLKP